MYLLKKMIDFYKNFSYASPKNAIEQKRVFSIFYKIDMYLKINVFWIFLPEVEIFHMNFFQEGAHMSLLLT